MKTIQEATAAGKKLLKQMKTEGWELRVWDNMGWHYCLVNHGMQIYQRHPGDTCGVFFSEEPDGAGGASMWHDKKYFKDPNKAVEHQMKLAKEYADKISNRVSVMEAVLSGGVNHGRRVDQMDARKRA